MTRLVVAVVVILVLIGGVLAAAGVLHFRNATDQSTITIDKKELKEKTDKAVEKTEEVGGKILDKTGETLRKAAERLRGSAHDQGPPTATRKAGGESTRLPDQSKNPPDNRAHESDR